MSNENGAKTWVSSIVSNVDSFVEPPTEEKKKLFLYLWVHILDREAPTIELRVRPNAGQDPSDPPLPLEKRVASFENGQLVLVRTEVKGGQQIHARVNDSKGNCTWRSDFDLNVVSSQNYGTFLPPKDDPRLSVALGAVEVANGDATGETSAEKIAAILGYIDERLHGSLDEAWQSRWGQRVDAPIEPNAEEEWARLVAEKVTYAPYAGPAESYFGGNYNPRGKASFVEFVALFHGPGGKSISERAVFAKVRDDKDPAHPMSFACQHVAGFIANARGFDVMYEADPAATQMAIHKVPGAKWVPAADVPVSARAPDGDYSTQAYLNVKNFTLGTPDTQTLFKQNITPGSVLVGGLGHLFGEEAAGVYVEIGPEDKEVTGFSRPYIRNGQLRLAYECNWTALNVNYEEARARRNASIAAANSKLPPNKPPTPLIGPGERFYAYLSIGPKQITDQCKAEEAHAGAILRVDARNQRLQVLCTSGLGTFAAQDSALPTIKGMGYGQPTPSMEGRWAWKGHDLHSANYSGHGILPEITNDALAECVKRLEKMRPLAFAQLVVLQRDRYYRYEDVVWHSGLVKLHVMKDGEVTHCFPYSRLLWALRGHPLADEYEVRWIVYAPRMPLLEALWNEPKLTAAQMVKRAFENRIKPAPDPKKPLGLDYLWRLMEIGTEPDGMATLRARIRTSGMNGNPLPQPLYAKLNDWQAGGTVKLTTEQVPALLRGE